MYPHPLSPTAKLCQDPNGANLLAFCFSRRSITTISVAKLLIPEWGNKVDFGIGLLYWVAGPCSLAGQYDYPIMPKSALSPQSGTENRASVQQLYHYSLSINCTMWRVQFFYTLQLYTSGVYSFSTHYHCTLHIPGQMLLLGLLSCAAMSAIYTLRPTPVSCAVIRRVPPI
jgi:hypothetical protein